MKVCRGGITVKHLGAVQHPAGCCQAASGRIGQECFMALLSGRLRLLTTFCLCDGLQQLVDDVVTELLAIGVIDRFGLLPK